MKLKKNKMNNIIGYKAPFDLWKGDVKKGTIYKLLKKKIHWDRDTYCPDGFNYEQVGLPKEIVESWEAVYENTKLIKDLPLQEDRKIIGYKLLKDLPKLPKGTISRYNDSSIAFYFNHNSREQSFDFTKSFIEENPDWFEPVYEKSQEQLVIRILNVYDNSETLERALELILEKYEIKEKE